MSKPLPSTWHPPGKFFVLVAAFFLLYILMPLVRDLGSWIHSLSS